MKKLLLTVLIFFTLVSAGWCADLEKVQDKGIYKCTLGEDEVIVGDELSPDKFKNKVTFTKWNKENFLSIEYLEDLGDPTIDGDKKVKASKNPKSFYAKKHSEELFKYGLEFDSKPDTNVFTFQLEGWEEFDFFYQFPLANINPDGSTWEISKKGSIWNRTAEVSGSYAIYHKTKRDYIIGQTNYTTGKFGHIYRPRLIDANNNIAWADLNITNGVYTLIFPQSFLDNAIYPIRANDTFGQTDIGGTTDSDYIDNIPNFAKALSTPTYAGALTSLSMYCRIRSGDPQFCPGLYSNTGTYAPNSKLASASTGTTIGASAGWITTNLSYASIVASTQYWLGYRNNDTDSFWDYFDSLGTSEVQYDDRITDFPTTVSVNQTANLRMSIYATYTPSASRRRIILIID